MKKKFGLILIVGLIIFFSVIIFNYVNYRNNFAVSDAAFVRSDELLNLSFKVGGKVVKLYKKEGDSVKKGELLAIIDNKDLLVQEKKLLDEIKSLEAKKEALNIKKDKLSKSLDIKIDILQNKKQKLLLNIKSFEFSIDSLDVKLNKLNKDIKRISKIYKQKLIQKEKLENLQTKQKELINTIYSKKEKLKALKLDYKDIDYNIRLTNIEKKSIEELNKEILFFSKKIDALKDSLKNIKNKISYTFLTSPINGIVAKRFINNNRVVDVGSLIYSVVNLKKLHLEVLLSEKKLEGVKVGNRVKIKIDAIKDKDYKGIVSSILPASAATFSLVPRDIASGEFTKLDQRFIVRIKIIDIDNNLKVGMGASVAIERK